MASLRRQKPLKNKNTGDPHSHMEKVKKHGSSDKFTASLYGVHVRI